MLLFSMRVKQWPIRHACNFSTLIYTTFTTTKACFYDAISKTVLKDRLRIGGGGNFVI